MRRYSENTVATIVAAEGEHRFAVEVTVAKIAAARLVADVSAMLARAGLQTGAHWSLTAFARDEAVEMRFGLQSQAWANFLSAAVRIFTGAKSPLGPAPPAVTGAVSAKFLPATKVSMARNPRPQPHPAQAPAERLLTDSAFRWS